MWRKISKVYSKSKIFEFTIDLKLYIQISKFIRHFKVHIIFYNLINHNEIILVEKKVIISVRMLRIDFWWGSRGRPNGLTKCAILKSVIRSNLSLAAHIKRRFFSSALPYIFLYTNKSDDIFFSFLYFYMQPEAMITIEKYFSRAKSRAWSLVNTFILPAFFYKTPVFALFSLCSHIL